MNKAEAAEILEIGVRSLERYTSAGRIAAQRVKMPRGFALDYDQGEVERFKTELEAERAALLESSAASPPHSPEGTEGATDAKLATLPATFARGDRKGVAMVATIVA